ncbi:winged helix-turn-helix transcriptional regulator [Thermococcus indicus]|uniref:Winged helix-turn-helix transcriptional regulator n=1 Tax=Thermococcus indicus TaxID=2586643 RepID=A0A4Y5SK56_9EURY|nr:helix-turn-helix domain-containing protein [Thermococcus indicus]QDA31273.1 winged helix-turn-helix transcriptional regulator [Thermococcus indicus]
MRPKWIPILMMITLILLPGVSSYTVSSLVLTVYNDGYVKVEYELLPAEYSSQIELPLLGNHYENVIVEDGSGNPLNFRLENGSLLIYSGDAEVVRVSYYTPDLTVKQGMVWTLNVATNDSFTVVLPENAIVVDLSDIPLEIAGNSITMPPGNQSVSYTLNGRGAEGGNGTGSSEYLPILAGLGVVGGLAYALWRRKGGGKSMPSREEFQARLENLDLNEEEKRALLYIFDKGGKASQAEVREAIGLPKTTAWRMFKRLERKGLVKVLKGRKENWVELRF